MVTINGTWRMFPNIWCEVAMTAIGVVGTPDGFIVAADGRMRLDDEARKTATAEMLSAESDYRQKIFQIAESQKNLVYAVTGHVIDPHGFDLLKIIRAQVTRLAHRRFSDCHEYIKTLSEKINEEINAAADSGLLERLPEINPVEWGKAWKIARIVFAGYFEKMPSLFLVEFFHYSGKESELRVSPFDSQFCLLFGSDVIVREMYQKNGLAVPKSRFAQYFKQIGAGASLDDAQEYATGYIKACSSPLALQLDKAGCECIGGHIHVAEITTNGFKWRIPPVESVPVTAL